MREPDRGEKGLPVLSPLEAGTVLAIRVEGRLFPSPDRESDLFRVVPLELTKGTFSLCQRALYRNAKDTLGRYPSLMENPLLVDISQAGWDRFADSQLRASIWWNNQAREVLFGKPVSTPADWLEFDKEKTNLEIPIRGAKALALGIYTSICELDAVAPQSSSKDEAESRRVIKIFLGGLVDVLNILDEHKVSIDSEKIEVLQEVQREVQIHPYAAFPLQPRLQARLEE